MITFGSSAFLRLIGGALGGSMDAHEGGPDGLFRLVHGRKASLHHSTEGRTTIRRVSPTEHAQPRGGRRASCFGANETEVLTCWLPTLRHDQRRSGSQTDDAKPRMRTKGPVVATLGHVVDCPRRLRRHRSWAGHDPRSCRGNRALHAENTHEWEAEVGGERLRRHVSTAMTGSRCRASPPPLQCENIRCPLASCGWRAGVALCHCRARCYTAQANCVVPVAELNVAAHEKPGA